MKTRRESPDIEKRIQNIRGQRVLLDADLADLYGVSTKRLNEQVKRNHERFPGDFAFQLSSAEKTEVVANCDHLRRLRYSPTMPRAFSEHGAIMAANVLNSGRAIEMSVLVVRAFVGLRTSVAHHREVARRLEDLERRFGVHDGAIHALLEAVRQLTAPPAPRRQRIGFRPPGEE